MTLTVNGKILCQIPMEIHHIGNRRCKIYDWQDGMYLIEHDVHDGIQWKQERKEWLTKAELEERKYPLKEIVL